MLEVRHLPQEHEATWLRMVRPTCRAPMVKVCADHLVAVALAASALVAVVAASALVATASVRAAVACRVSTRTLARIWSKPRPCL